MKFNPYLMTDSFVSEKKYIDWKMDITKYSPITLNLVSTPSTPSASFNDFYLGKWNAETFNSLRNSLPFLKNNQLNPFYIKLASFFCHLSEQTIEYNLRCLSKDITLENPQIKIYFQTKEKKFYLYLREKNYDLKGKDIKIKNKKYPKTFEKFILNLEENLNITLNDQAKPYTRIDKLKGIEKIWQQE